ncbi:NHL repeat-containing protein [Oceanimonas marisflavi]|uniref:NHL repeat-containing protein n=1 Tax=Oceanimonas marisflavi TaxID=2059724 RepID=UPI000D320A9C|nr:NHL repeat-containing protein [Oceanimonas marisflavi]
MFKHLFILLLLLFCTQVQAAGIITTYAGGGPNALPAVNANLYAPFGVVVDNAGNTYVAALEQHRVFKIDSSGELTVVAGNGILGFSGDGGDATHAQLHQPWGVTLDTAGNLYIADNRNHRIRRVDADTGEIDTVAGNGSSGFSGDGGQATSANISYPRDVEIDLYGNLYIADSGNNRIRMVDTTGIITTLAGNGSFGFSGDGGPATSAQLGFPIGVAVDTNGNLYIADVGNHRIRKVDADTGEIDTVAGNGSEGFSGDGGPATSATLSTPTGVTLDTAGNLYIADYQNHRIRRVNALTGEIDTVAGNGSFGFSGDGGAAISAELAYPFAVAVDTAGNLYIADRSNHRIRKVDATGTISTLAGNGSLYYSGDGEEATHASLDTHSAALDTNGNLYIADYRNHRIRRVNALTGEIDTVAGNGSFGFSGDGGPATSAQLRSPVGVAVDTNGNLYIADGGNHRIRKVDADTGEIDTVAGNGSSGFSGDGGAATSALFRYPQDVAVDTAGNLYIADTSNHRIRKVDASTGIITTAAGNGSEGFSGDGGHATSAELDRPFGVALDNDGNLYIADSSNHRIRRVDALTGIIDTVAGNDSSGFSGDGGLATSANISFPRDVEIDLYGNIYIADSVNNRIRMVDTTGIITTLAGNGSFGFSGDGGPATSAQLRSPVGVAVDTNGNLYIADGGNNRIRLVTPEQPPLANASGPYSVNEGGTVVLDGSASTDPDGDPLTYAWDLDNDGQFDDASGVNPSYVAGSQLGAMTIALQVTDLSGASDSATTTVTVQDVAPVINLFSANDEPLMLGNPAEAHAVLSCASGDVCTAQLDWGDGTTEAVVPADGNVTLARTYANPGVYALHLTLSDDDGNSLSQSYQYVVVFDASGSFVTGGGHIQVPAGAMPAKPELSGQANFGLVAKYQKGKQLPQGHTEFRFQVGELNFRSLVYDWLVVAGAQAKYKGTGQINGGGEYGFMVSATDGDLLGSSADKFRIKIWDKNNNDEVVFDNEPGADDDAAPTSTLSGGQIVIHESKGKK